MSHSVRSVLCSGAVQKRAEENNNSCDTSVGRWVRDPSGPAYTAATCPTLPASKNCHKYGKDPGHLYWRWRPDGGCDDLPRSSPARFLAAVRGKRLAFIGDSLARNHMESLLCLLSQAEAPTKVSADDDGVREWRFPAHGFTLMAITTRFLARAEEVLGGVVRRAPRRAGPRLGEPPPAGARLRRLLHRQLVLPRQLLLRGRSPRRLQRLQRRRRRRRARRLRRRARRPPRRQGGARGHRPVRRRRLQARPRRVRADLHAEPLRARLVVRRRLLQSDAATGGRRGAELGPVHRVGCEESPYRGGDVGEEDDAGDDDEVRGARRDEGDDAARRRPPGAALRQEVGRRRRQRLPALVHPGAHRHVERRAPPQDRRDRLAAGDESPV
ncbi:hypothetical protein EE612_032933, partial [Oryza sativa]